MEDDPAEDAASALSPMPEGSEGRCPGPALFPLAEAASEDDWARLFQYPTDDDTGAISLGSLMDEPDPETDFILAVYDEIQNQTGGIDSDAANDFLTNFFPPKPEVGDQRTHHCELQFESEGTVVSTPYSWLLDRDPTPLYARRGPQNVRSTVMSAVYTITVTMNLRIEVAKRYSRSVREVRPIGDAAGTAAAIIRLVRQADIHRQRQIQSMFVLSIASVFLGVGVGACALRVATTVGARLLASTVIVFEAAEGISVVDGYLGGKQQGYNPLREAFKYLGETANGESGKQTAEIVFNTLNIVVGFGGRVGVAAGGLYAGVNMVPNACTPAEGEINIIDAESIPIAAQAAQ
ncbi:hypothetical protein [Litoreibacter albidus]|uniref:hypothetical protein n=1 Tax=Litoreibacter albidus TaxID=670155 RepID=UPI003735C50F